MSENTKGTEPRVLHKWLSADLTDRQVGRMEIGKFRGEFFTRTRAADGWTGWTHANADDKEIARLAASNRALREENERLRDVVTECADVLLENSGVLGNLGCTGEASVMHSLALQANRAALSPDPAPSAEPLDIPSFEMGPEPTCGVCGLLLRGHWRQRPCAAPSAETSEAQP